MGPNVTFPPEKSFLSYFRSEERESEMTILPKVITEQMANLAPRDSVQLPSPDSGHFSQPPSLADRQVWRGAPCRHWNPFSQCTSSKSEAFSLATPALGGDEEGKEPQQPDLKGENISLQIHRLCAIGVGITGLLS